MDRNIITTTVVPASSSLSSKETYTVDVTGAIATSGATPYGVVRTGRPKTQPSEIIIAGETACQVDGSTAKITAGDPLTGGSSGVMVKATLAGSSANFARAIALETTSSKTSIQVLLL